MYQQPCNPTVSFRQNAAPARERPRSILVTRFKSIGDVLFTLPALGVIRENFPDARIAFLTSKENGPLIKGFSEVDEIITIDRSLFRSGNLMLIARELFRLLQQLRRQRFSLAIDFQGYGETAILTWLTGAPQRWGTVYRAERGWVYTRPIQRSLSVHPVDWNLSLLKQCGLSVNSVDNQFVLPVNALSAARELFGQMHLDTRKPTLFIQPFTSALHKNWPLQNYLVLANYLRTRGIQILFGGGPLERTLLEPARQAGFAVSAGATILASAGLMKLCSVIVGGDTGLLHLAAAMKKRVVFLANASSRIYPFQHPDWKVAPSAGLNMSGIAADTIIRACTQAFANEVSIFGGNQSQPLQSLDYIDFLAVAFPASFPTVLWS